MSRKCGNVSLQSCQRKCILHFIYYFISYFAFQFIIISTRVEDFDKIYKFTADSLNRGKCGTETLIPSREIAVFSEVRFSLIVFQAHLGFVHGGLATFHFSSSTPSFPFHLVLSPRPLSIYLSKIVSDRQRCNKLTT